MAERIDWDFGVDMLHSAMATLEATLTPAALEDHWGLTSYAHELANALDSMRELDAGIVGLGPDDNDALEWLYWSLISTRDVCWMRQGARWGIQHPACWRVGYAADQAAKKLALVVGDEWISPEFRYSIGGAEADARMAAYRQQGGLGT